MLKVRVRFDKQDEKKTIKLDGYASDYPEVGKDFSFFIKKKKDEVHIDLGKVFNVKSYGDMLLVQTDLIVAEVWLLGEIKSKAEVLPFVKNDKTLFLKDGKLTCLRKTTMSRQGSLIKLNNLLNLFKEDAAFRNQTPKPSLRLVKQEDSCLSI